MIRLVLLTFASLICMCMPSYAQNIEEDATLTPIHFKQSWEDPNNESNKDLTMQPLVYYNGGYSLIICQDYPSQYDELFIISPSGKSILHKTMTSSSQPKQSISLQGIRSGIYTLYLYEGDRFWYGTFTLER